MGSLKTKVLVSGLILACLSACNGAKHTRHPDYPVERFWEPLLENCSKSEKSVTCDLKVFRQAVNDAHKCWEKAGNLQIDVEECRGLAFVDKSRLQNKVNLLEQKLDEWWRLPLTWAAVGILAGFGLGFGIKGL